MAGDSKDVARAHLADAGVYGLPEDWDVITLGDIFTRDRGIAVGVMYPGDHDPDGVPLIKAGDLNGSIINPQPEFRISKDKHHEYSRSALEGGELLMTLVGNVGQCAVVPPRMAGWNAARAVAVMRLADPTETHFVQQVLLSRPLQHLMDVWCNTTVQATLNLKEIRQLPLPWPPKKHRDAIAEFGKALDDKIELNRRMNATLEAMARALFQSWFIDFDPVRANMDRNQPSTRPVGHPSPSGRRDGDEGRFALDRLFPDSFQDSPLGHIPKGWTVGTVGDIGTNLRRGVQPCHIAPNTPYIALEHMPRRSIALSDWDDSADVVSGKSAFKKGEILFGKLRPYFHKVGVAPFDGVCSTDILVLAPKSPEWFGFLLGHASSDELIQLTDLASTGTKMPRTNWRDISSFKISLPPKTVAAAYTHIIQLILCQIHANIHQSRTLATLRDTLLPKLLSGELSVSELNANTP